MASGEHVRAENEPSWSVRALQHDEGLLATSLEQQEQLGCVHTLREILQQPDTWVVTAAMTLQRADECRALLERSRSIILSGSGSSEYAGECVRLPLQKKTGLSVQTLGSGTLLTNGATLLPGETPFLMVSFARSGDSPESVSALLLAQRLSSGVRHLVFTCNAQGKLSTSSLQSEDVSIVVLDQRTNDQSLVMTSSFTNMVLAALSLAYVQAPGEFLRLVQKLSDSVNGILQAAFRHLPLFLRQKFQRAFYLASPSLFGAARESALKMTEMTAGRVVTVCETYLGLRHGPMSAVHADTLIVCFLSADPIVRAYELDVMRELSQKQLGLKKLIVGSAIPQDVVGPNDLVLDQTGLDDDETTSVLYVVVGQVMALLRCLQEGLRPDAPSQDGVINRVVGSFRIYGMEELVAP